MRARARWLFVVVLSAAFMALLTAPAQGQQHRKRPMSYWIAKQVRVATIIGRSASTDPWPNCSDPIWDGAANWRVTVKCENKRYYELFGFPRAWLDSPGFFRCGLQFHPNWERKYGRLCP